MSYTHELQTDAAPHQTELAAEHSKSLSDEGCACGETDASVLGLRFDAGEMYVVCDACLSEGR